VTYFNHYVGRLWLMLAGLMFVLVPVADHPSVLLLAMYCMIITGVPMVKRAAREVGPFPGRVLQLPRRYAPADPMYLRNHEVMHAEHLVPCRPLPGSTSWSVAAPAPAEPASTSEQYRASVEAEWTTYVADKPIYFNGCLAYNRGDSVPASNVYKHGYFEKGLVTRVRSIPNVGRRMVWQTNAPVQVRR
jgi:hypothetical protein